MTARTATLAATTSPATSAACARSAGTPNEAPPAQPPDGPIAAAVRGGVRAVGAELLPWRHGQLRWQGLPAGTFGGVVCSVELRDPVLRPQRQLQQALALRA